MSSTNSLAPHSVSTGDLLQLDIPVGLEGLYDGSFVKLINFRKPTYVVTSNRDMKITMEVVRPKNMDLSFATAISMYQSIVIRWDKLADGKIGIHRATTDKVKIKDFLGVHE